MTEDHVVATRSDDTTVITDKTKTVAAKTTPK